MKKKIKLILCAVGFIGCLLLIMVILAPSGDTTETNAKTETPKKEKKEEDKVYAIGETLTGPDLEVTITKAYFSPQAEYGDPEKDKVLTVEVEVKNIGKEKITIDNTEFSLYDPEGNVMDAYYSYDELALSQSINGGKQLKGKLFYDVINSAEFEMIYTPAFSYDGSQDFTFGLKDIQDAQ